MATFIAESRQFSVPAWVTDINAFRRWNEETDFDDDIQVCWLKGEVWVVMGKEQIFSHVLVKTKCTLTLAGVAEQENSGLFLTDGALLSHFDADISVRPDGLFLLAETLNSDRVRLIEGQEGGFVEIQGTPDMVLEILSDGSVRKDAVVLKEAYYQAGIPEYWLVDARGEEPVFDIFRHMARGYVRTTKQDGWMKSNVFGKSFRLQRRVKFKHPDYVLEVR